MSKRYILLISLMSLLLFVTTNLFVTKNVEATLFGYKWSVTNYSGAVVKVRNANLSSNYSNALAPGYNKWNNYSTARISISSSTSPERGVISFQQADQSTWKLNGWGTGEAWAMPINLDSSIPYCVNNPNGSFASECNNKVTSGVVWINSSNVSSDSNRRAAVVAHEIGHMIGLAHQGLSSKQSIMATNLTRGYDVTGYDANDVNSLY